MVSSIILCKFNAVRVYLLNMVQPRELLHIIASYVWIQKGGV